MECYWSFGEQQSSRNDCILPDGCVDILFSKLNREPLSLTAVGLMTAPLQCDVQAGQSFFGVRFRPGMAAAFLREAAFLNDKVEPLESIWQARTVRSIFERLAEAGTPQQMAEIMESVLRPVDPPDAAQRALWQLSSATMCLDQLVFDTGLSERHFRRVCMERSGVSPKYLQRILRFRNTADRVRAMAANQAQPSWAQLAAACGYYDQAHLIRDFQQFAGTTPGRFLQSLRHRVHLESNHNEPIQSPKSN